jgi:hypothetical protein
MVQAPPTNLGQQALVLVQCKYHNHSKQGELPTSYEVD